MKKIIFFFIVQLFSNKIIAQDLPSQCGIWPNQFSGFEIQDSLIVQFDTLNPNNQWMIGVPHKIILDTARSPVNVLMTDTINPCLTNDTSYVTIRIRHIADYFSYFKFHHRYDIDSLHQKAYLECSYDNGYSWKLMNDTFNFLMSDSDAVMRYWISNDDWGSGLKKGPYFIGTENTWQTSGYYWEWYEQARFEESREFWYIDSILVRFVFINDSVATNHEGWMIDDIEVWNVQGCGGINSSEINNINISPVPASGLVEILSHELMLNIELLDVSGRKILSHNANNFYWKEDVSTLTPGIYLLNIKTETGSVRKKIVVD